MQLRKKIAIVGLQRSGTNFLHTVIASALQEDLSNFWKHALFEEVDPALLGNSLILLIAKHPVMWLQSCLVNRPEIFSRSRMLFFSGVSIEIGLARLYSVFHRGWLDYLESGSGLAIRYEDLLAGSGETLIRFLEGHGRVMPGERSLTTKFSLIANSIEFSEEDRQRYLRLECALDRDLVTSFWNALDPAVAMRLGYRIENVTYAPRPTVRSLAYRLLHRAGSLSADEFVQIKEAAKTELADDGELLYRIGQRVARNGDHREALDWYLRALPAAEIHMAEFGGRTPIHMSFLDLLDDIAKTCSVLKAQKLQGIETFRKAERQNKGELLPLAAAEWAALLSDVAQRRGKLDEAIRHAQEAVEACPDLKWYNYNLGLLLSRADRLTEAETELRVAIAEEPRDAARHFALSDVLMRQGRIDDAIVEARAAMTSERIEPWYFHHCGSLLLQRDRFDEAAECFKQAAALEPNDRRHRFVLSDVLARMGQLDAAIAEAEKAVQGELVEAWYFHHHASLLIRTGRLMEAEKSLRVAIDIDPEDYRHHFLLSDVLMRQERIEEAVVEAEVATVCKDAVPWCFHHLGALQMRLGRTLEAEASLRRAVALELANGRHRFLLSDILARLGRVDEAIIEARHATEFENPAPWDFYHLGALLTQTGQLQAAEAAFRRALAMEPDNEHHRRALDDVLRRQALTQESASQ